MFKFYMNQFVQSQQAERADGEQKENNESLLEATEEDLEYEENGTILVDT